MYLVTSQALCTLLPVRPCVPCFQSGPVYLVTSQALCTLLPVRPCVPCFQSGPVYLVTSQALCTLLPVRPCVPCYQSGPVYLVSSQALCTLLPVRPCVPCYQSGPVYLAASQALWILLPVRPCVLCCQSGLVYLVASQALCILLPVSLSAAVVVSWGFRHLVILCESCFKVLILTNNVRPSWPRPWTWCLVGLYKWGIFLVNLTARHNPRQPVCQAGPDLPPGTQESWPRSQSAPSVLSLFQHF